MQHKNLILRNLPQAELTLLNPYLKRVHLNQHHVLFRPGDKVPCAYFPTTAIVSLVVGLAPDEMIEAAMIGRDGVVGASSALDGKISLNRAVVQLGGEVLSCDADALRDAAMRSRKVLSMLMRHEQALFSQAQQTTVCMSRHVIEARLCRWLQRAFDLANTDTLHFTHEYLSEMLGVRRTSVSEVAMKLQTEGLIKYSRGRITRLDEEGLRNAACQCYSSVNKNYETMLGFTTAAVPS